MGPGVNAGVLYVILRRVRAFPEIVPESELKYQHPRYTEAFHPCSYVRRYDTEVLGDEGHIGKDFRDLRKKSVRVGILPLPLHSGFLFCRDGPVLDQPPEMIYPNQIKVREGVLEPPYPPAETIRFENIPVVDGVAPPLACRGKVVRRNPCNV